uniref:tudor domain-containing protein 15 n=1 Tax=Myxine glutinosa TaxID=7769 RepID=UPI00358FDE07
MGKLRTGVKSHLVGCLEELVPSQTSASAPPAVDIVLDGAAVVNMLQPDPAKTFDDDATAVFLPHIRAHLQQARWADIVWDEYFMDSLKAVCIGSMDTDKQVITTHHSGILCNQRRDEEGLAPCNHEEADTRIMLHVQDAVKQGDFKTQVLIIENYHHSDLEDKKSMFSLLVPRLETGVPQPVIVTVVKSPDSLHCQLQCLAPELRKLTREMKSYFDRERHVQVDEVEKKEVYAPGTPCAVLRASDNVWYRAVVWQNQGHVVEVSFVDVGLVEMVSLSQLRPLLFRFVRLPVQAFLCRLLYQGDGPPSWNDEQTAMLRSLVHGRSLVALLSSYNERDKSYSIVLIDQNSRSINSELSRSARSARPPIGTPLQTRGGDGCEVEPEAVPRSSQETKPFLKLVSPYRPLIFQPGHALVVQVSSICTPGEFSCQVMEHVASLKIMMEMLQVSCANALPKPIAFPGPCAARCNVDRRWHRGFALGPVQNGTQVCVLFVDYGNDDLVMVQDLLPLPSRFLNDPAYAFRCCLHRLTPVSTGWPTPAADAFQEFVEDSLQSGTPVMCNVFMLIGLASGESAHVVDISTPFQDAAGMLVTRCFARYLEAPALLAPGETFRSFCYSSHGLKVGSEATVAPVFVKSPLCFYCHLKSNRDQLEAFMKALNDHCKDFSIWQCRGFPIEEGPCFARYGDRWHRAMALSRSADGLVRVFFVDYGSEKEVYQLDLLPISADALKFVNWPMQAVQCCLNDLEDVSERELDLTKDHFLELVDCPLRAVVSFRDSDGRLGLELYRETKRINTVIRELLPTCKNVSISNKVAPQVDEEDSGDTSIKCRRLCPRTISQLNVDLAQGKTQFGQKGNESEDCVEVPSTMYESQHRRQRNASGSPEEGRAKLLETTQTKKRKIVLSPVNPENAQGRAAVGCFPQSLARSKSESLSKVAVEKSPAQQWPVTLPTLASFPPMTAVTMGFTCSVFVSYASSPQSIFVQLASDENCIGVLADELNAAYATLPVESVEESLLIPGVVVAALFSFDCCWYRAVILGSPETDGTVAVEFVDYGNSEKVPVGMVRSLSATFLMTPRMSIPCCIAGSCLMGAQKTWSNQVLECVADLTKSDELQCKFLRKYEDLLWEVNLFEGGEDFADCLAKLQDYVAKPIQSFAALVNDAASLVQEEVKDESIAGKLPTVFEAPMEPGTRYDVYISVVLSPLDFWCQLKADADGPLWDFMQEIEEQDVTGLAISGPLPQAALCLARYGEDGALYRARVTETRDESTSVLFVDFGNLDDINMEDLKQIPSALANVPPFAFHCQLEGCSSAGDEIGSVVFQTLVIEKPFNMEVVERDVITDTLTVRLYDEDGELLLNKLGNSQVVETDVKQLEVLEDAIMWDEDCKQQQLGVVEATIQGSFQQGCPEETVENQELLDDACQSKGNKQLCLAATQEELLSTVSAPSPWPENALCVGQSSPVFLTMVNPNCSFALQLQSWQEAVERVQSELANVEKLELLTNSPMLRHLCVARYSADDLLYRAEVASLEPGSITVQYIDFGNFETISYTDLKLYELPPSLLTVPALCVQCHVEGLPEPPPVIAARVCDYLWSFIEASVLCATFVCHGADGLWQVLLKNGEESINHQVMEIVGQVGTAVDSTVFVEEVSQNLYTESLEDCNGHTNSETGVKILDEASALVKDDSGLDFESVETSSITENKNGSGHGDLNEQLTSSLEKSFSDMANSSADIIEFVEKKQNHGGLPFDFPISGRQDVPIKEKLQVEFSNVVDAERHDQPFSSNCNYQQDDLNACTIISEAVDALFCETVKISDLQEEDHCRVLHFHKSEGAKVEQEQQHVHLLDITGSGISPENQLDPLLIHWPSEDHAKSSASGNLQGNCELETEVKATVEQFPSPTFIDHGATLSESNYKEIPVFERVPENVCGSMVHSICVSDVKNERDDKNELHETSLLGLSASQEESQKSHFAVPVKELFPEEHVQEKNFDKLNEQSIDVESIGVEATCTRLEDETCTIFPFESLAETCKGVETSDFSLGEKGIEEDTIFRQTLFPIDYSADLKNDNRNDSVKEMDEKIAFHVPLPLPEMNICQDAKDNETLAELRPTLVQELSSHNLDVSNEHLLERAPTEVGTTSEASLILSMEFENSNEGETAIMMPVVEDEATLVPPAKKNCLAVLSGGYSEGIALYTSHWWGAVLNQSHECTISTAKPAGNDALAEGDEPCTSHVCNPDGAVLVERDSPEMFFEEFANSKACSLGNNHALLDKKDTEVMKMGEENDLQDTLLLELGTGQKEKFGTDFVEPILKRSLEKNESCSNLNTPLDEHVDNLRSTKSDSSARYEEKMLTFDLNVEDSCEDEAQHLSLDEMTVAEVPQENLQDVGPTDTPTRDIEGKQLALMLIRSHGEQLDELQEEIEFPISGLFGNEDSAENGQGLCPVVEKDTPEIVSLDNEFEAEECIMGNEPLGDIGGMKGLGEEDELCKESLSEMSNRQEASWESNLSRPMLVTFPENVLDESYSNVDMPNSKQVADLGTIESELADASSGETIAQFEKAQGGVEHLDLYIPDIAAVRCQEKSQVVCVTDMQASEVFEGNLLKQFAIQSQSSDLDKSCEGQFLTVDEPNRSDAKAEGYDKSSASHCHADGTAIVERGATEIVFDECTIGNGTLDGVKKKDIEFTNVLGEESDLPEALLPELGTCQKVNVETSFVEPILEQSPKTCIKENSLSKVNFLFMLVKQVACLESNKNECSASFEEKISTFDVNVKDSLDYAQHLSLDKPPATEVPQVELQDVGLIDSSAMDIEGTYLVPMLIGSQGEQPAELHEESKLPSAELFGNENASGHYQGLCLSSCNPHEVAVLDKDITEIVPLEKAFQVEECSMGNESDDGVGGMKDEDEESELCEDSLAEINTSQGVNQKTDLVEEMLEPFAEPVLEESYSNVDVPNTEQMTDLGTITGERIVQFEMVEGGVTATVGPQEEEKNARQTDEWESDVFDRNLPKQSLVQSQSSDLDNSCEGQLLTVDKLNGSDAKAEGCDYSSAFHICNADVAAVVESGSTEIAFDEYTIGNDALDGVKKRDIEVVNVLGEDGDLSETLLPELGTYQKANPKTDFVEPMLERSPKECIKEESCSNFTLLVEQLSYLESNKSESSASFEEKMPPFDVNVEDSSDDDEAQHLLFDELVVTAVCQEKLQDVGLIDSSAIDIEGKSPVPILIGSQGEQPDEFPEESKLPIAELFGNENASGHYQGLCLSCNPDETAVLYTDIPEIVPLEKAFQVEECSMGNESDDGVEGMKDEDEESELCKDSLSEINTSQGVSWKTDLVEEMLEPFAEPVLEESYSNADVPNTEQVTDLGTITGERIAQFEMVEGGVTATVVPQEEEKNACQTDELESDVFDRNLPKQSLVQSQSSDLDNSCEGQLLTVDKPNGSDAKAEGCDYSSAFHICNADIAAVVESGSAEIAFDEYTIGNDALDGVKKRDIEVVNVLGEDGDLSETLLPELGTYQKANLKTDFVEPMLERSSKECIKEESCSNFKLLVEQVSYLESNKSESSASFEEKMPPFDVNVEDSSDDDEAQHLLFDELIVSAVCQEKLQDVGLIDSSAIDIERKSPVPILIGSQGEQPDEFPEESKLPIAELFGNENASGHYQGLCPSCNPDETAVLYKDIPEIVPLEKVFQVEECSLGNEPDNGIGGMKDEDEGSELCKESQSEINTCQGVSWKTDLVEQMFEPFAEPLLEKSYSNVDVPSTEQVTDLGTIADVNSGETIAQFEKVQGGVTATVRPQEEEKNSCQMEKWESDVFEGNLPNPSLVQSQSSDLDDGCEGQLLTDECSANERCAELCCEPSSPCSSGGEFVLEQDSAGFFPEKVFENAEGCGVVDSSLDDSGAMAVVEEAFDGNALHENFDSGVGVHHALNCATAAHLALPLEQELNIVQVQAAEEL